MSWLSLENPKDVPSPGLLLDPDRVQANINRMITMVGGPVHVDRLRPHLKTHKMARIVQMQLAAGIRKFKAATLAEAEMAAEAGAREVLVAYQLVGPRVDRMAAMLDRFSGTAFSTIVDDQDAMQTIASKLGSPSRPIALYVDVDCGMGRTGVLFGEPLNRLRHAIESRADVTFAGLHVYDGHLHDPSLDARRREWEKNLRRIEQHVDAQGEAAVVGGGSPTFGLWAAHTSWECSPGTALLWDIDSRRTFRDLPFELAAAVITRVISKPGEDRLCLDLGYKAIAAERPLEDRVFFPELPEAEVILQNEEHLLLALPQASRYSVGDVLIGHPVHICPTVALYAEAFLVSQGKASGECWRVTARDR